MSCKTSKISRIQIEPPNAVISLSRRDLGTNRATKPDALWRAKVSKQCQCRANASPRIPFSGTSRGVYFVDSIQVSFSVRKIFIVYGIVFKQSILNIERLEKNVNCPGFEIMNCI
jgi:hypothetical protein